jgi:hypothetical protein
MKPEELIRALLQTQRHLSRRAIEHFVEYLDFLNDEGLLAVLEFIQDKIGGKDHERTV